MSVEIKFNTEDALGSRLVDQARDVIIIGSSAYGEARAAQAAAASGNTGDGVATRKLSYAADSGFTITTVDSGGTNINAVDLDLAVAAAVTPTVTAADLQVKIRAALGASGTEVVTWDDTNKRFKISDADLVSITFAAPGAGTDLISRFGFVTGKMDAVNNIVYGAILGDAHCGDDTKDETWSFECIAASADSGTFSAEGSVSGEQSAQLTVGTAYASDNSEIADVHIADGAADFVVGDIFTLITYASKINVLTPLASVSQYRTAFGEIRSGAVLTLKDVAFRADDYGLAMVIASLGGVGVGQVYFLSAKAHGYSRAVEPTNVMYDASIVVMKTHYNPKIVLHESQTEADQIDLAQACFDESGPVNMKPTFGVFSYGINGSQTNHTARAKAIDDGVTRGTNTMGIVPYALVSPGSAGALDENNVLHATVQRAISCIYAFRSLEADPAMPLHEELEIGGFGGLSGPWSAAEHSALNAGGVTTLKAKAGSRIVIHQAVTCVNLQGNGQSVYQSWRHESVVWAALYLLEVTRDFFQEAPYNRAKNTSGLRENAVLDLIAKHKLLETVTWPSSRGAGVIQNVDDYADSYAVETSDTDVTKWDIAVPAQVVSPLIDKEVTISLIL